MISFIHGLPIKKFIKGRDFIVDLLTSGGVGYRLNVTASAYSDIENIEPDKNIDLYCSFQVREDSQVLYGFTEESERNLFEMLITVSGVGPKTGIAILSFYKPDELSRIIFDRDDKLLSKVPGLGGKGAQKIIIELQNKILLAIKELPEGSTKSGGSKIIEELEDALKSLGFRGAELNDMLKIGKDLLRENSDIKIENLIEIVLKK